MMMIRVVNGDEYAQDHSDDQNNDDLDQGGDDYAQDHSDDPNNNDLDQGGAWSPGETCSDHWTSS